MAAVSKTLGHTRKEFATDTYVDMKALIRGKTYFKNSDEVISNTTLNYPLTDEMKMLLEICEY